MIGHTKGNVFTGFRRQYITFAAKVWSHLQNGYCGIRIKHIELSKSDIGNYEEYLGSVEQQKKCQSPSTTLDPRVPKRGPGPVSTAICNHTGFAEGFALTASHLRCGYTAKGAVERMPVFGLLFIAMDCLFINRGGTQEDRDKIVEQFMHRQVQIEEHDIKLNPIGNFAEGTSSNGTSLMPFKRGGFQGMRTVQPCFVTFETGQIVPAFDTLEMIHLLIMLMSSLEPITCKLTMMPEFTPNTVMLEKHADKGEEPWEIFSWCVRDLISKTSGLPKDDNASYRNKAKFVDYMQFKTDVIEIDGKIYG